MENKQEMAATSSTATEDIKTADLSKDVIDKNTQNTSKDSTNDVVEPIKDNTLKGSIKRFIATGSLRVFALIGVIGLFVFYIIINALFGGSDSKGGAVGSVTVPKTNTAASAIVTPDQAEYIKAQQEQAGLNAEKNGETYIPEFVTESQPEDDQLGDPSQPTVGGITSVQRKNFFDAAGNSYTADQAASLASQGKIIEGVTVGVGSISDPNITTANKPLPSTANSDGGATTANSTTIKPYVVKPYPASVNTSESGVVESELISTSSAALNQSVADTEEWTNQYLATRARKAQLYDAKAQRSFEKQIENLESALKPPVKNVHATRFDSVVYLSPVNPELESKQATSTVYADVGASQSSEPTPVIYAGETFRAILKNEVNTDTGNEVIATILQGKYKGATVMGVVSPTNGNIQFNFNRLMRKGMPDIAITAVARQIDNNSSGMADTIKRHYLKRYSALILSSALSGIGDAYEQTAGGNATIQNSTVVTSATEPTSDRIVGNAVGELGDELSDEIKRQQNTPTTYITQNGKVFNLFFTQSVVEPTKK